MHGNVKAWAGFWLLGLIWGSSYLFIRISITGTGLFPGDDAGGFNIFEIVFIRTLIGALGLGAMVFRGRHSLPRDRETLAALVLIGLGNVVLPFLLITWGEQYISSSMAARCCRPAPRSSVWSSRIFSSPTTELPCARSWA